ncbi:hypothetical protein D3C76_1438880 [compost metagenome]
MHGVYREAIVGPVRQLGIDIFHLARQGRERYLQPDNVTPRHHHIADPVRRPGVIQHRFAFFEAGDGIGDHGGVVALIVLHGFAQAIGFTAPARGTAGQVGLAVTVGIKQLGNFRIF